MSEKEVVKRRFIEEEGDEEAGLKLFAQYEALEAEWLKNGKWLSDHEDFEKLNALRAIADGSSEEQAQERAKKQVGKPKKKKAQTQAQRDAKRADSRGRNWTIVLYPDDLPTDWHDKVRDIKCKMLLSPLHDKDLSADGTPKKAHYHLLMMFDGIKSLPQIQGLFVNLFGENENGAIPGVATISKKCIVHDRGAMVRYLVHMDNPEKYQYSADDIEALGGADLMELLRRSMSETQSMMIAMEEYIEENGITELCDFARAIREDKPDWYLILTTKATTYFNAFIRSYRHKHKNGYKDPREKFEESKALEALGMKLDEETGEIIPMGDD